VIVRILGEGQLDVDDTELDALNTLDRAVENSIEAGNEDQFRSALDALLGAVRQKGRRLPDDSLTDSDLILPPADASLDEVREILGDEGLIPDLA